MIYQAATTIQVPINQMGRNYFPDIQKIAGRNIRAIGLYPDQLPIDGGHCFAATSGDLSATLSLTSDGSTYVVDKVNIDLFDESKILGQRIPIDCTLSVMDCFIDVRDSSLLNTIAVLVVWYDNTQYATGRGTTPQAKYDNLEVRVVKQLGNTRPRFYLPDMRTLAGKRLDNLYLSLPTTTPNYKTGLAEVNVDSIYISLCKGSFNVIDQLPLRALLITEDYERLDLDGILFDLTSSYVEVASNATLFLEQYVNLSVRFHD